MAVSWNVPCGVRLLECHAHRALEELDGARPCAAMAGCVLGRDGLKIAGGVINVGDREPALNPANPNSPALSYDFRQGTHILPERQHGLVERNAPRALTRDNQKRKPMRRKLIAKATIAVARDTFLTLMYCQTSKTSRSRRPPNTKDDVMDYQINFPTDCSLVGVYCFSMVLTVLQTWTASSKPYEKYRLREPISRSSCKTPISSRGTFLMISIYCMPLGPYASRKDTTGSFTKKTVGVSRSRSLRFFTILLVYYFYVLLGTPSIASTVPDEARPLCSPQSPASRRPLTTIMCILLKRYGWTMLFFPERSDNRSCRYDYIHCDAVRLGVYP